jgi:hypothetical protein
MSDFVSPVNNPIVPSIAKALLPIAWRSQDISVAPTGQCLDTFEDLRDANTVVLVNHADRMDPLVVFSLSRFTRENFYYLSARELFTGVEGWVLQQCGAYSVVRGTPADEQSRERTIELIAEGQRKLIEFPEGDVSGRDDEILPLKTDGLHNIVEAQNRLISRVGRAVYLLPTVIYYEVDPHAEPDLMSSAARLEEIFGMSNHSSSLEDRLDLLLAVVIDRLQRRYNVTSAGPHSGRLRAIVGHAARALAKSLGVGLDEHSLESEAGALHSVRSAIRQLRIESNSLTRVLDILQQLLILASTLEQQRFTLEKAWRILDRLELLLLHRSYPKGHRRARVTTAVPINLRAVMDSLGWDETLAVQMLEARIRSSMKSTLLEMQHLPSLQKR